MSPPFLLIVAALLFGLMSVLAKHAMAGIPGTEVAFVRFLVGLVGCAVASLRFRFVASNWVGLAMRGLFGGAAVYLYFVAIEHLPVGIATLLNYSSPIFTALYALVFLGESVTLITLLALSATMSGVTLVMLGASPGSNHSLSVWHWVGLGSAALSGAAIATMRELRKTDGSWEIFASFCLVGAVITGVPSLRAWVEPSPRQWIELIGVGLVSIVAQIMMTHSLRFVEAARAGVISQLTPIAAICLGWVLYAERLSLMTICGVLLTLAGVSAIVWPRPRHE